MPTTLAAGSQQLNPNLAHGWHGLNDLSHHLSPPRVCIRRKLQLETEPAFWCGLLVSQEVNYSRHQMPVPKKIINSLNIWWNSSDDYNSSLLGGYFYFGDFLRSTASRIQITHVIAYDNLIHGPFSLSTWPPLSFGNLWSIPLCCQITDIKLLPFSYVDAWKAFSTKDHLDIYHIIHGPYKTINIKN